LKFKGASAENSFTAKKNHIAKILMAYAWLINLDTTPSPCPRGNKNTPSIAIKTVDARRMDVVRLVMSANHIAYQLTASCRIKTFLFLTSEKHEGNKKAGPQAGFLNFDDA
jgi:hypothetical protein